MKMSFGVSGASPRSGSFVARAPLALTLALSLAVAVLTSCGGSSPSETTIIGGTKASEPYPFFVSLIERPEGSPFCGASLISENVVLTAAHCAVDLPATLSVRIEPQSSESGAQAVEIPVRRRIVHEGYDPNTMLNDVALLLLSDPAPEYATPVALAAPSAESEGAGSEIPVGYPLRVIGKGNQTTIGWAGSQALLQVDVQVLASEACSKTYTTFDGKTQICAGSPSGGKDSCQGDSGGPLFQLNVAGRASSSSGETSPTDPVESVPFVLQGIVSYGEGCAQADRPGVYTRVSAHAEWINKNTEILTSPAYPLDSDALTRVFDQGCFTPVTQKRDSNVNGGSINEQRLMRLNGKFTDLKEGRNSGLIHRVLRGSIAPYPGCVSRTETDLDLKFYWAQTPSDIRTNRYQLLVRVGDEPGFSFAAPLDYDSNWQLSCEPASDAQGQERMSWDLHVDGSYATLGRGDSFYLSSLTKPKAAVTAANSTSLARCSLGKATVIELREVTSGPDVGALVGTVSNVVGPRSGRDYEFIFEKSPVGDLTSVELRVVPAAGVDGSESANDPNAAPYALVITNMSTTDVLYGWRLSCDSPLTLSNLAGQLLIPQTVGEKFVYEAFDAEQPESLIPAQGSLRLGLQAPPSPEGGGPAPAIYCQINGYGSNLEFPTLPLP